MTRIPLAPAFLAVLALVRPAAAAEPSLLTESPVLTGPSAEPVAPQSAAKDAATYEHCMALTRSDPKAAERLAQSWQKRGGAHPAEHCAAVALIELGHYKEGAARLDTLGRAMMRAPDSLRAGVFDEEGQAWLLAGDPARADAAEGEALKLMPDDASVLIDRAEVAGLERHYADAVIDLSRVLKADPRRVDALIYRATAYRELDRLADARTDIDKALQLSPGSVPALLERGNIRSQQGDLIGARQDWQRVGALAPGTAAAHAAADNIVHLEAAEAAPASPAPPTATSRAATPPAPAKTDP